MTRSRQAHLSNLLLQAEAIGKLSDTTHSQGHDALLATERRDTLGLTQEAATRLLQYFC